MTGTPASCGYFAARKNRGLCDTIPKAFESASCTAVAMDEGFVWSSMISGTSLCPLTPPSAFCRAIRALNPAGDVPFSDAPSPVRSVM